MPRFWFVPSTALGRRKGCNVLKDLSIMRLVPEFVRMDLLLLVSRM